MIINNFKFADIEEKLSDVDITEPKFAIKSASRKIYITAKEGNFLNKNEILLNQNVKFKSNDFSIETQKVVFIETKKLPKVKANLYLLQKILVSHQKVLIFMIMEINNFLL